MPFWQRTEGVRANNKRAVLVVYSKESPCLLRCTIALPKKSSVEPDAPTTVHLTRCCFALAGDPKGCRGRAKSPCLCRRTPTSPKGNPCWGSDAPTTARLVGCRPEGGSTFFRSERKYQRKRAARRLQRRPAPLRVAGFGLREPVGLSSASVRFPHPPGKSPLLLIFERGSSQCRAQHS